MKVLPSTPKKDRSASRRMVYKKDGHNASKPVLGEVSSNYYTQAPKSRGEDDYVPVPIDPEAQHIAKYLAIIRGEFPEGPNLELKMPMQANPWSVEQQSSRASSMSPTKRKAPVPEFDMKQLIGQFDLFSIDVDHLADAYFGDAGPLDPERLFLTLLAHPADKLAAITIPDTQQAGAQGKLYPTLLLDPMIELPDITVTDVRKVKECQIVGYRRHDRAKRVPGIEARLSVRYGGMPKNEIGLPNGDIRMRPLWKKATHSGQFREIFEGCFHFDATVRRTKRDVSFWAIRGNT
ncbi:hypothetical protein BDZ97DRAFT_1922736 [Flammula alnicola]|nr:hypothetical protein BDZ97DRAFT_1922736 [Flammula alnicola]